MTYELEIHDRSRTVSVQHVSGSTLRVTIDGREHLVDAVRVSASTLSLILPDQMRASREVTVQNGGAQGELLVRVAGAPVRVAVNRHRRARRAGRSAGAGTERVTAPMPGRVVRVLVGAGDTVAAGQGLVIVEAMKMENELRSPRAGVVTEVGVTDGMSVEAGRLLVVVD